VHVKILNLHGCFYAVQKNGGLTQLLVGKNPRGGGGPSQTALQLMEKDAARTKPGHL
jgi:hypothetical protein